MDTYGPNVSRSVTERILAEAERLWDLAPPAHTLAECEAAVTAALANIEALNGRTAADWRTAHEIAYCRDVTHTANQNEVAAALRSDYSAMLAKLEGVDADSEGAPVVTEVAARLRAIIATTPDADLPTKDELSKFKRRERDKARYALGAAQALPRKHASRMGRLRSPAGQAGYATFPVGAARLTTATQHHPQSRPRRAYLHIRGRD